MDTRKKIRILKGIDVKKLYKLFATLIFSMLFCTTRAFAAGTDPLAAINNLSTFVFAAIKAVGVIILGWGVVQIGLGVQGHDPTQKSNGFLSFFGGLIIAFSKSSDRGKVDELTSFLYGKEESKSLYKPTNNLGNGLIRISSM